MSQVVRAGRLPDWLREQLAEAQQVAATGSAGDARDESLFVFPAECLATELQQP